MCGDVTQTYECDCGGDFSADDVHQGGGGRPYTIFNYTKEFVVQEARTRWVSQLMCVILILQSTGVS